MHPKTYKRNVATITAISKIKEAKPCLVIGENYFSIRVGKRWARFATAEEVIAFVQGALAWDDAVKTKEVENLLSRLRGLNFTENLRRVP